ncbi:MAG: hypothetical protein ACRDD8_14745 [Bacteroidales bacterium]
MTDANAIDIISNEASLELISDFIIEPFICNINGEDIFQGDVVALLDNIYGNKVDFAVMELDESTNTPMCSYTDDYTPLLEIMKIYTITRIAPQREIRANGMYVCGNVCTHCLNLNIKLLPIGTSTYTCDECGAEY